MASGSGEAELLGSWCTVEFVVNTGSFAKFSSSCVLVVARPRFFTSTDPWSRRARGRVRQWCCAIGFAALGVRLARANYDRQDLDDLRELDAGFPFGRVCQPSDIADVVVYLCSEAAGYVTGQRIVVDGGAGPAR